MTELQVVGPVDFAHPAAAQQADDAVAAAEERAGGKRPWSMSSEDESQPDEDVIWPLLLGLPGVADANCVSSSLIALPKLPAFARLENRARYGAASPWLVAKR